MSRPRRAHLGSAHLAVAGLLALLLTLAGCAAKPTPYQPATDGYGFSQQRIEGDRYRVTFAGNSATSLETVRSYMLYRAAEVTVESGHDYFVVVDQNTQSTTSTGSSPLSFGTGFWGGDGGGGGGGVGVGVSSFSGSPDDSFTAWSDIVVGKGAKPAGDLNAYDAREVLSRLDSAVVPAPGVMRVVPPPQQQ
jgi:hypothetical protein